MKIDVTYAVGNVSKTFSLVDGQTSEYAMLENGSFVTKKDHPLFKEGYEAGLKDGKHEQVGDLRLSDIVTTMEHYGAKAGIVVDDDTAEDETAHRKRCYEYQCKRADELEERLYRAEYGRDQEKKAADVLGKQCDALHAENKELRAELASAEERARHYAGIASKREMRNRAYREHLTYVRSVNADLRGVITIMQNEYRRINSKANEAARMLPAIPEDPVSPMPAPIIGDNDGPRQR